MPSQPRTAKPTKKVDQTEAASENRLIDDIHDLVAAVELENVAFYEERGRRVTWTDEERDSLDFPLYANSLGVVHTDNSLSFRFRMVFTDENAEYVSDVAAEYSIPEQVVVDDQVQLEFAERVAFMTVYPYMRASIFGSAVRLGQPAPILAIVRPGDFKAGDAMTDEEARAAFFDAVSERG